MKTLSVATVTIAFLAAGAVGISPATAGTITFDYSGNISGNVTASPVVEILIIPELENFLELAPGTIPTEYNFSESFSSSFTVLDDPAQFEDGDITLDASLFGGLFEPIPSEYFDLLPPELSGLSDLITTPNDGIELLDSLFNANFTGTGNLVVDSTSQTTNFAINYFNDSNAIVINGYDPNIVSGCLTGACTITTDATFGVSVVLSGLVDLSDSLGLEIPSNISPIIDFYQTFVGDDLSLASGTLNLGLNTSPVSNTTASPTSSLFTSSAITSNNLSATTSNNLIASSAPIVSSNNSTSVPEPGVVLGLLGVSTWMLKKSVRKRQQYHENEVV
ncbi:MAG: hypothetical protein F6K31_36725 [Symploca sp. SIO2G7]|nr:hypothetical protein [Symploca sp. SIO2G7]